MGAVALVLDLSLASSGLGSRETSAERMAQLTLHLQDGFDSDQVVIHADGREVFRGQSVTTKKLLGYAETIEIPIKSNEMMLEISISSRHIETSIRVDLTRGVHIAISVESGDIAYFQTIQAPGYM